LLWNSLKGVLNGRIPRVIADIRSNLLTVDPVAMRWNVGQIRVSMAGRGSESE